MSQSRNELSYAERRKLEPFVLEQGKHTAAQIAEKATKAIGRPVTASNVYFLREQLGLVTRHRKRLLSHEEIERLEVMLGEHERCVISKRPGKHAYIERYESSIAKYNRMKTSKLWEQGGAALTAKAKAKNGVGHGLAQPGPSDR